MGLGMRPALSATSGSAAARGVCPPGPGAPSLPGPLLRASLELPGPRGSAGRRTGRGRGAPGWRPERRLSGCARGLRGSAPAPGSVGSAPKKRFSGSSFREPGVKVAAQWALWRKQHWNDPPTPTPPQKVGAGAACVWAGFEESAPGEPTFPGLSLRWLPRTGRSEQQPRAPFCSPKARPLESLWPPAAKTV